MWKLINFLLISLLVSILARVSALEDAEDMSIHEGQLESWAELEDEKMGLNEADENAESRLLGESHAYGKEAVAVTMPKKEKYYHDKVKKNYKTHWYGNMRCLGYT